MARACRPPKARGGASGRARPDAQAGSVGRRILHGRCIPAIPGDPLVSVEPIQTVYAKIENKPGTLERATRAIKEKKINIDALSVETSGPFGFLRILTPRARDTTDVLRAQGIEAYESQAILVNLPNKPGEINRATSELAAAGLNVEALFTTSDGRLALRTHDNERAAMILRKL